MDTAGKIKSLRIGRKSLAHFYILIFLCYSSTSSAQLFGKMLMSNEDNMELIASFQTSDNYLIFTESNFSSDPGIIGRVIKYNQEGNLINQKAFMIDSISVYPSISSCIQTKDNGYLLLSTIGYNGLKYVIVKLDPFLNVQWTKKFYIKSYNYSYHESITELNDYSIIISAEIYNPNIDNVKMMLTKLDQNGNIQWERSYYDTLSQPGYELLPWKSLATADDGFLITGTIGSLNGILFISKFDTSGSMQWMYRYLDASNANIYKPYSVQRCHDGGIFIAGYHSGKLAGDYYPFVLKTESSGNVQWAKFYDTNYGLLRSVNEMSNGDLLISGSVSINPDNNENSIFLIKANNLGDTLWTQNYRGTLASNLYESNDSLILLASTDYYAFYPITTVLKLNNLGNYPCNQIRHLNTFQNINSIMNSTYQLKKTYDSIIQESTSINYDTTVNLTYIDYCLYNSINDILPENNEFKIYPNPASDVIFVHTPPALGDKQIELLFFNSMGQQVLNMNPSLPVEVPITFLPTGLYELVIISNNEKIFSSRFIKL